MTSDVETRPERCWLSGNSTTDSPCSDKMGAARTGRDQPVGSSPVEDALPTEETGALTSRGGSPVTSFVAPSPLGRSTMPAKVRVWI